MSDTADTTAAGAPPADAPQPAGETVQPGRFAQLREERPEVLVGAAFAGGIVLAMILKRMARD